MKKLLTTLLILFLSLGLFAETGYTGIEWGTPKSCFKFEEDVEDAGIKTRTMQGEETKVYYSFYKDIFDGISYSISTEKTKQLLKKYSDKIGTLKIDTITKEAVYKELDEEYKNEKFYEYYLHNEYCKNAAMYCDILLENEKKGSGQCTVYIYNYNEDTRVYIFENLVEGRTFVYYTFREQDY